MFIEFRQVLEHREMQEAVPCAICGCRFDTESVVAQAIGNDFFAPERPGDPVGVACPACVEYLGKRNLERFPTVEEHEAALRRYPSPVFASDEDLNRADREGTISAAYDASWIAGVQLTEFGAVLFELMRGRSLRARRAGERGQPRDHRRGVRRSGVRGRRDVAAVGLPLPNK